MDICQMNLTNEELIVLSKYMKERFFRQEIKRAEFDELLSTEFPREFYEEKAANDMVSLGGILNSDDLEGFMSAFENQTQLICLRTFKRYLFAL